MEVIGLKTADSMFRVAVRMRDYDGLGFACLGGI